MATQYFNPPKSIAPCEMLLRDVVRMKINANVPWGTCIVKFVDKENKLVKLYRPYGVSEKFEYTGGVICYTGLEEYTIYRDEKAAVYELLERPDAPE